MARLDWLFLSLCETTYANKQALMYFYNFFKVVYEKTIYKDTIFVSENLRINIKIYLFA
jgi:hypothetical protein